MDSGFGCTNVSLAVFGAAPRQAVTNARDLALRCGIKASSERLQARTTKGVEDEVERS